MRLMPNEAVLFQEEIKRFHAAYHEVMAKAVAVFEEKAKQRDRDTPIWHTYRFPEAFIDMLVTKSRRLEAIWGGASTDEMEALRQLSEELPDIINYAAYLDCIIKIYIEEKIRNETSSSVPERPEHSETERGPRLSLNPQPHR